MVLQGGRIIRLQRGEVYDFEQSRARFDYVYREDRETIALGSSMRIRVRIHKGKVIELADLPEEVEGWLEPTEGATGSRHAPSL